MNKDSLSSFQFVYAMYDFNGEHLAGTLSIAKGQALKLIRECDEKGNRAWRLVENRNGAKGYVPHNYVAPSDTM